MSRYSSGAPLLNTILHDMKKDFMGTGMFFLKFMIIFCRRKWCYILNSLHFLIAGVKKGNGTIFTGWTILNRYPQSSISFGSKCSFNSARNVNLIGVNRNCIISTQSRRAILKVKNNCGMSGATIAAFNSITIGNNVKIGANVLITDSDWHPEDKRAGESKPVIIEDNVWLGVNSTVLKGVTIGANTIIGAGSVVTTNIPANVIAAGNPCKIIRDIITN